MVLLMHRPTPRHNDAGRWQHWSQESCDPLRSTTCSGLTSWSQATCRTLISSTSRERTHSPTAFLMVSRALCGTPETVWACSFWYPSIRAWHVARWALSFGTGAKCRCKVASHNWLTIQLTAVCLLYNVACVSQLILALQLTSTENMSRHNTIWDATEHLYTDSTSAGNGVRFTSVCDTCERTSTTCCTSSQQLRKGCRQPASLRPSFFWMATAVTSRILTS